MLTLFLACAEPAKVDSSPIPSVESPVPESPSESDPPRESDSEPPDSPRDSEPVVIDEDGDGFPLEEDCDDTDASVYPGAREICGDELD